MKRIREKQKPREHCSAGGELAREQWMRVPGQSHIEIRSIGENKHSKNTHFQNSKSEVIR